MTRVLFWNIENFAMNKVFAVSTAKTPGHGNLTDMQASIQRRAVIYQVLQATQPDIIVIIEVSSGHNGAGLLATPTGGIEGMAFLQFQFNQHVGTPGGWNLVPPLFVGAGRRAESVGILYRRTNDDGSILRYFTGPNIWTGGLNGTSVPPGTAAAARYTVPPLPSGTINVDGMLAPVGSGPARQIPAGTQHNAGQNENVLAARVTFVDALGNDIDFNGLREPYMATFAEVRPSDGAIRDVSVFGIHAPPNPAGAAAYITTLSTIPDIVGALGANETRVIGGDFNANLLAADGSAAAVYNPLTAGPGAYQLLLRPTAAGVPTTLDQYRGYFSTHIRGSHETAQSLFLWSDTARGDLSYYPGYGYVGSDFTALPVDSIDNVLVWPHRVAPYNYQTTIMNTVTGTPFGAVVGPTDNPPSGSVVMPSLLGAPPPVGWPFAPTSPDYPGIGAARALTGWNSYGKLRSTSDHFGIYATI